jgi:hypothetical protein
MLRQVFRLMWLSLGIGCSNTPSGDTQPFSVSAKASLATDGQGILVTRVSTKSGYHFNDEYPTHFIPDESEQITFAQSRFDLRPDLALTPCPGHVEDTCEARAAIPFRSTPPGNSHLSGTLGFSVCSPKRCLIEKAPLRVALHAGE